MFTNVLFLAELAQYSTVANVDIIGPYKELNKIKEHFKDVDLPISYYYLDEAISVRK